MVLHENQNTYFRCWASYKLLLKYQLLICKLTFDSQNQWINRKAFHKFENSSLLAEPLIANLLLLLAICLRIFYGWHTFKLPCVEIMPEL